MIFLATDFGLSGPYLGQVKAVIARRAPGIPVIDLFADLPAFQPQYAAYLLAAYVGALQPGDVMLAVVDPGVGSDRLPLVIEADGCWFVGPDNGLFEILLRRAHRSRCWAVTWRPPRLSPSFHGRDLFAPVAAGLATGEQLPSQVIDVRRLSDWPDDLPAVVYVDHYGNAITGMRASWLGHGSVIEVGGERLMRARTFSDVEKGAGLWYENANGLAEIALNGASAAEHFDLRPGSRLQIGLPS
jgi:S-adenosylmethionine hydrolase